jgi:NADH-quinone oxidoreductase subunit J
VSLDVPNVLLLALLLGSALMAVLTADLVRSAIGLALTSAVLTLLLFQMNAPLAGVFELSVCAGLITVVFISTISLTKPAVDAEARQQQLGRWKRYIVLPLIVIGAGWLLCRGALHLAPPAAPKNPSDVSHALWFVRRFDLVGQILVILAGVFGVVVLFKVRKGASGETKE